MSEPELLVACLCAQWCGVCRDYADLFGHMRATFPHARFVWVDIEDQSDVVDPIEVETFPTLLIAVAGRPVFFGALAPQAGTLERIVRTHVGQVGAAPAVLDGEIQSLVDRLGALR